MKMLCHNNEVLYLVHEDQELHYPSINIAALITAMTSSSLLSSSKLKSSSSAIYSIHNDILVSVYLLINLRLYVIVSCHMASALNKSGWPDDVFLVLLIPSSARVITECRNESRQLAVVVDVVRLTDIYLLIDICSAVMKPRNFHSVMQIIIKK